jgi:hypothetical protein
MLCSFFNSAAAVSHSVNSKEGGLYQSLCHYPRKPYGGTYMVFKSVCRDSSEIYHCLLLVS